jgi:DNA mismatch endonuclease (patch repair protein)
MSRVRSQGSKCERTLRAALVRAGAKGFRVQYDIIGRPDFAFPEHKVAVFCDSAFWHGNRPLPTSNISYWHPKIARNRARDKAVNGQLRKQGWTVVRLTEGQILESPASSATKVLRCLRLSKVSG